MLKVAPILLAIALLFSIVAEAKGPPQLPTTSAKVPEESSLVEHGHYRNKNGETVHSPAHVKDGKVPQGASAKCLDGTYSFSHSRSGTCSRHGGVASWL